MFLRARGELDAVALERSLNAVIERHEVLRTRFSTRDGQPVQQIAGAQRIELVAENFEGVAEGARWVAVEDRARQAAREPFDLAGPGAGPLVRARLLRLSAQDHVVLVVMHHIVCDGWSMGVLLRELGALYAAHVAGGTPTLPALAVQYADFAHWQRQWLQGSERAAQLAYWMEQLAGAPAVLELPADRPRPRTQTFRGAHLTVPIASEQRGALHELSRAEGVTLFMTLLAAYDVLLWRYTGQPDVVVGSPIAGRTVSELEPLIGFFVNTLVLRTQVAPQGSFRALLGRVREVCLGAYAHQDLPFEQLVDAVNPVRSLSHAPLFQVAFVLQNVPGVALELPGISLTTLDIDPGLAKFDLTLLVRETAEGLVCTWEYNTDLLDEATVARMARHYLRLLDAAVADPGQPISALPVLGDDEQRELVVAWNATRTDTSRDCIHTLFEAQVERTPDATAVVFEAQTVSYRELDRRANQLAHHLRRHGVGPEVRVGLCIDRSVDMMVGLLGILKAGGAYVPLDPDYPIDRLAYMLADAGASVVVTQERLRGTIATGAATLICVDTRAEQLAREDADAPTTGVSADNLAYVIYTSGSTGTPKGVAVTHRSVANFWAAQQRVFGVGAGDRVLQFSSLCFDMSVWEITLALGVGASLCLTPRDRQLGDALVELVREQGVTTLVLVPSALAALGRPELPAVTKVLLGGEAVGPGLVHWSRGRNLFNGYGPTESTIVAVAYEVTERSPLPISIGRPIANTQLYVLDAWLRPVPIGVAGELFIGGDGLARGYLDRPGLTAERFVPDPFGLPGERIYRTGDRVRYLPDGNLEFLGRIDRQVKLRGFRIELGEVEARLLEHRGVKDAVVVLRDDRITSRLVAYVAPQRGAALVASELRAHLKERLPEHMVPSVFMVLDALPVLPNGKLDRAALPAPEQRGEEGYEAPATAMGQALAELWGTLLGVARVGARDSFFELGGHSLLATQLTSRVRAVLGVELPVRAVFEAPTLAELAKRLEDQLASGPARPALVAMDRGAEAPLSFAQQRLWFLAQLEPGGFTYNVPVFLRVEGALDASALERSLNAVIERHEVLRTRFGKRDGQPVQQIAGAQPIELVVEDFEGVAEGARWAAVEDRARQVAREPFDLDAGPGAGPGTAPLVRARLLRLTAHDHVVLVVMHHIVCDGWSMGVLLRELGALYAAHVAGGTPALPALAVQYADFAHWQRQWLQGSERAAQLAYWMEQLAGAPAVLELPTDRPRPRTQTFRGTYLTVPIASELRGALHELSRAEGVTLFMTLLAAYDVLLWRYTGQPDIVVGSPIAGRTVSELEPLIGFFVNTLVLRTQVAPQGSFRALLGRVREVCLGAYAHQDLPFEQLVDAVNPVRSLSHAPLFQVAFTLQNVSAPALVFPGVVSTAMDVNLGISKFDLTLTVRETADELMCAWEYNTDLFDEATVARMAGHYLRLLGAAVADPELSIARLPLLGPAERHRLVVEWNPPHIDPTREGAGPAGKAVEVATPLDLAGFSDPTSGPFPHELFEAQALQAPDARAVVDGVTELTYRELDRRADQLAWRLRELGAGPDVVVAICLERSVDMVVSLLAILKAGAAYLPLDPSHPGARLRFTLEDSTASILIIHGRPEGSGRPGRPEVPEREAQLVAGLAGAGIQIVRLDQESIASAPPPGVPPGRLATAHNLAYVIYTSGSTGKPKGVELRLAGLAILVRDMIGRLALGPTDTWVAVTTLSFDIASLEMLGPICSGGTVVVATRAQLTRGDELCALIANRGCTIFQGTPSTYRLLLEAGLRRQPLQVSRWVCGGERVSPDLVDKMAECGGRLINGYGPTETTIYSTMGELEPSEITIGRPVGTTQVYILSADLELQPIGVVGEIYIGGGGLARGYRHRPALTAERFVPDAFGGRPGARMYRTGDLGRRRADGRIECLGRTDDQVKVRGHRIELGEVEAVVVHHPSVAACAATVREDVPGDVRLIAYVVARDGMAAPAASELRELVRASLPESMMPSRFVTLAGLPLTSSGKVDRKALPAPDAERDRGHFVAPGPGLETELATIWAEVLRLTRVGTGDNFFDLGGNSLLLQTVRTRIEATHGRTVPLVELFEFPTIGALAAHLAPGRAGTQDPATATPNPTSHGDDRRKGLRQLASKRRGGRDAS